MQQSAVHIDDYILSERLMAGDPGAREMIYDHYGPALYTIILQVIADNEKAENALAQVFVYIFNDAVAYRDSGDITLFGWMRRVARQMALKLAVGELEDNGTMVSNGSLLFRFTTGLPEGIQTVFRLCYYKGLSREAVARMLGLHPEEVASQLREAMVAFRKFLNN
ncbi:RNA polymerase sigma-70 factor, ECF subfamily [Chitinophaga sp. YR573]|uniref:RNA polymerase sigma factor n=1 Tax=Chitinophaga sp. YR573 TaxID=1881040 RepID=UPI0008B5A681|nr:sigma-70 family RNA polymerase sigma factor [Chitinophaga sp. YR573]SEW12545.1 RNA polymerase sigma-70 factor, ECF subfamily [Chitinophaga sp. YR573]